MADLRTTRQVVEVIGEMAPKFRTTRQVVEVVREIDLDVQTAQSTLVLTHEAITELVLSAGSASSTLSLSQAVSYTWSKSFEAESIISMGHVVGYAGPIWVSAATQLILDQSAYLPQIFNVSATSVLSLSHSVDVGGTHRLDAASVITLNQYADNIVKTRSVESTLVLTQSASYEKILTARSDLALTQNVTIGEVSVQAENALTLSQEARHEPFPQSVGNQLNLTQTATCNLRHVSAESTLQLSQSVNVGRPYYVEAESELTKTELVYDPELVDFVEVKSGLGQSAEVQTQLGQSAASYMQTTHSVDVVHLKASGTAVSASNALTLSQDARLSLTADAASQLVLTQVATGAAGRPIGNTLDLTQAAVVSVERALSPSSTLEITQAATYTLVLASTRCQYSPFVGSSTDPNAPEPPPVSLQGPMAGIQVPFQLVYPAVGVVTDSVSLKTPNLGNKDRLAFHRIQRETRGGTLVIYADPDWPRVQTLALTFSGLLRVEAQELLTFVDDHLGQEIGLIDWEHRFWKGVIVSPDEPIVEDRFDSFTANITFEGELDPTWNPQVVPPSLRYSATRTPQQGGYYVPNEPIPPVVGEATDYNEAEADATIKIGYPLYLTGAGHVNPAQADTVSTSQVVGISISDVSATETCKYLTEGRVARTDWTEVAGTTLLSAGATYFLDPSIAGHITTTAPTTVGQSVVRVGRAINTTTLDIEIELPILL